MEKIHQVEAVASLILGICLMLEGMFSWSETLASPVGSLAIVVVGPAGLQKAAQTEFLRRRYRLPVIHGSDLAKSGAVPARDGFVLEDYPTTKDRADRLAELLSARKLAAPVVVEIADRRLKGSPVDLYKIESRYPLADIWTFDGTLPAETVSRTLQDLLDKTPAAR